MPTIPTIEMMAETDNTMNSAREKSTETVVNSEKPVTSYQATTIATKNAINEGSCNGTDDSKQDVDLSRTTSNASIAKPFSSLPQEILFVGVICLSQFLTRE
jgi:hypothetical protein